MPISLYGLHKVLCVVDHYGTWTAAVVADGNGDGCTGD